MLRVAPTIPGEVSTMSHSVFALASTSTVTSFAFRGSSLTGDTDFVILWRFNNDDAVAIKLTESGTAGNNGIAIASGFHFNVDDPSIPTAIRRIVASYTSISPYFEEELWPWDAVNTWYVVEVDLNFIDHIAQARLYDDAGDLLATSMPVPISPEAIGTARIEIAAMAWGGLAQSSTLTLGDILMMRLR